MLWIEMEMSCLTSNKISHDIKTPPHMQETEVPGCLRGFMLIKLGHHLLTKTFNNTTHHFCFLPQFPYPSHHRYCIWILDIFLPLYYINVIVVIQKVLAWCFWSATCFLLGFSVGSNVVASIILQSLLCFVTESQNIHGWTVLHEQFSLDKRSGTLLKTRFSHSLQNVRMLEKDFPMPQVLIHRQEHHNF